MEIFVYNPRERATVHLSARYSVVGGASQHCGGPGGMRHGLFLCVICWLVLVGGRLYALAHGMRSVGLVVVRVVSPAKRG